MKIISIKIPDDLRNRIRHYAEQHSTSPSALIREAVEKYLSSETKLKKGSFLDRAEDILGTIQGPEDLSVNKNIRKATDVSDSPGHWSVGSNAKS